LGFLVVSVEEVHQVHVSGRELSCVNFIVVKHAGSLVHCSRVGATDEGLTVVGQTSVDPAILLGDGDHILDRHVQASSNSGDASEVSAAWVTNSLVKSLDKEGVDDLGLDLGDHLHNNGEELIGKCWGQVVSLGVHPAKQEVVVAVGETLSLKEPFLCLLNIELSLSGGVQWQQYDIEGCISGLLDPSLIGGSLDTSGGPVPSILGLNNVELVIEPESHGAVSSTRAGAVHNNRVKTIESLDHKEVTRVNVGLRNVDLVNGSGFNLKAHTSLNEVDVGLLHVWGRMASN